MTDFIDLCGVRLPVVPQRHAYLKHKLSAADFESVLSANYARESYRVLSVLIPALPAAIPEWKWEGYSSAEAMEQSNYIEEHDESPSFDDISRAFEMAIRANGGDRVGKLLGLIQTVDRMNQSQAKAAEATSVTSPA